MISSEIIRTERIGDTIHTTCVVEGEHGTSMARISERPWSTDATEGRISIRGLTEALDDRHVRASHEAEFYDQSVQQLITLTSKGMGLPPHHNSTDYSTRAETAMDYLQFIESVRRKIAYTAIARSQGVQTLNDAVGIAAPDFITGMVYVGPGIVPRLHATERANQLIGHLAGKTTNEIFEEGIGNLTTLVTDPFRNPFGLILTGWKAATTLLQAGSSANRYLSNRQPIDHQAALIKLGTEPEEIKQASEHCPIYVVAGVSDVMNYRPMWKGLESDRIHVIELADMGHDLVYTPSAAIPAINEGIRWLRAQNQQAEPTQSYASTHGAAS